MAAGEPLPGAIPVDVAASQPQKISNLLKTKLAARNIEVPVIEHTGASALLGTNETIVNGFLEELRAQRPDGYFVGIGLGHALAFLPQLYSEGQMPRGVILADIDHRVVAVGHMMFETIANSPDVDTFNQRFFGQSEEEFLANLEFLRGNFSEALQRQIDNLGEAGWRKIYQGIKSDIQRSEDIRDYWDSPINQGVQTDVIRALQDPQVFQFYKTLIERESVSIEYTDFANPGFIQTVRELPGFSTSRSIIYTSNIVDHITHRGHELGNLKAMDNLRQFEDSEQEPIFIDALQANNYYLRAAYGLPTYEAKDFKRTHATWTEKPEGLLFPKQSINPDQMDLASLPDRAIRRYYERFMQSETARHLMEMAKRYYHCEDITKPGNFIYLETERRFARERFEELKYQGREAIEYGEKRKQQDAKEHPLWSSFIWGNEFDQFSVLRSEMRERKLL